MALPTKYDDLAGIYMPSSIQLERSIWSISYRTFHFLISFMTAIFIHDHSFNTWLYTAYMTIHLILNISFNTWAYILTNPCISHWTYQLYFTHNIPTDFVLSLFILCGLLPGCVLQQLCVALVGRKLNIPDHRAADETSPHWQLTQGGEITNN